MMVLHFPSRPLRLTFLHMVSFLQHNLLVTHTLSQLSYFTNYEQWGGKKKQWLTVNHSLSHKTIVVKFMKIRSTSIIENFYTLFIFVWQWGQVKFPCERGVNSSSMKNSVVVNL